MTSSVNRGKRIEISVDGYTGLAGFTEDDGKASISFPSSSKALREGAVIEADGRDWTVVKVGPSVFLRGYRTAELIPAGEA